MSLMSRLLRFARKVVESVLNQLNQLLQTVMQEAMTPMNQMVQQVVSGVWVGKGADAFVEEVQSIMVPNVNQIANTITTMNGNLRRAIDVVDDADSKVRTAVNGLDDLFSGIF